MNISTDKKLEAAIRIWKSIDAKVDLYRGKRDRARKDESYEKFRTLYWFYHGFQNRAFTLVMDLRNPKKFGDKRWTFLTPDYYLRSEEARVTKGRIAFETKHKYSLHFFRAGLHLDYGTYTCDKCDRTFYHSPSTITRALKVVYSCACGYCTNEIIKEDWNEEPYY